MANDPLNWLLLAEVIVVVIVASAFLFYWNRLGGRVVAFLIRLYAWRRHNAYVSIGSLQVSPLAGRIAFRDIQYHSSNLSVRALHGHVTFRYWWARVRQEGDAQSGNSKRQKMPSRIMVNLEGVEMFVFNRTPAYDNIVERMKKHEREEAAAAGKKRGSDGSASPVKENPITLRLRKVYKAATAGKGGDEERLEAVNSHDSTSSEGGKVNDIPNIVRPADPPLPAKASSVDWFREMLPVDIRVQTGSVILGSDATPMLLIGSFKRAEGKLEITDSRSICDKYKMIVELRFEKPKVIYRTNKEYSGPLLAHGKKVYDKVVQEQPDVTKQPPSRMSARPAFQALAKLLAFIRDPDFSIPPIQGLPADRTWKGLARYQDHAPSTKPFVESKEYAKVSTLLDTPLLELTYFADTPGPVPDRTEIARPDDRDEFGNVDLPPEYGIDISIYGGQVNYGPWADRQRDALQRAFAPSIFFNTEPLPKLKKGDTRIHANLALTVQICQETTLRIPTRDPSRDWKYAPDPDQKPSVSGKKDKVDRPYAWLEVKVGANSSVIYSQAQYATKTGYDSMVVLHLDSLSISSSVNSLGFISARACKLSVTMPTPLEWNAQRNWGLDVTLENPKVALLRDHVTLISDLSRDWSGGAAADYHHFVPMHYNFRVTLLNYEFRLYINDNNVIDNPLSNDENAFLVVTGPRLSSYVSVDASRYRPATSVIPFSVSLSDAKVSLMLPNWDTHYTFTCSENVAAGDAAGRSLEVGKVTGCKASGSYRYFSSPHPDHQETLILHLDAERVAFKCLGWVLRRLFCVKDNYFGMFTQFSQSMEFLHRHAADPKSIGDPVEEKYHPGRSDALAVNVTLDVRDSLILLSDEIYACDSGLAMPVPQFQMALKSVESFMELSLDAPPTYIVPALDFASVYDTMEVPDLSPAMSVLVEGLSIKANRLFGPQPRGATYLCLWEASFPSIVASITPAFMLNLKQSVKAVIYGFVDEENAPTKLYVPESDPDVTFFKLSLGSARITIAPDEHSAMTVDLSRGVNLDTSSLATLTSVSSIGVLVPEIAVAVMHRPHKDAQWTTIGSMRSGFGIDVYNNPDDCRKRAGDQQRFIRREDKETRRIWYMYGNKAGEADAAEGLHSRTVYMPRPRAASSGEFRPTTRLTPVFDDGTSTIYSTDTEDTASSVTDERRYPRKRHLKRSFVTAKEVHTDSDDTDASDFSRDSAELLADTQAGSRDLAELLTFRKLHPSSTSEAGRHSVLQTGVTTLDQKTHGRLIRLRVKSVTADVRPQVVMIVGSVIKGFSAVQPRATQTLDNLLDSQVDAALAGVSSDTPLTLDATIPSVLVKTHTDLDQGSASQLCLRLSDTALLLRKSEAAGFSVKIKIAALATSLDATMYAAPAVHLGHVDPRYDGAQTALVRYEHRGLSADLVRGDHQTVIRVDSAATDARFVSASVDIIIQTAAKWTDVIAQIDFQPKPDGAAKLVCGLIHPDGMETGQYLESRPIFASVKSSPLHKEDERNIRLNHGWRILSQLRMVYMMTAASDQHRSVSPATMDKEELCELLGGLDWFEESAYALTLNQTFVQQIVAALDGGRPIRQAIRGSTSVIFTNQILSLRHHDRLLGKTALGVSSVVATGMSAGAIMAPAGEGQDAQQTYRCFGAIKSVGVDIRDSIIGLARNAPKPTAKPEAAATSQAHGREPRMGPRAIFDLHVGSLGVDITAGGLRMTTIVDKLHAIASNRPLPAEHISSLVVTYEKTNFTLLALGGNTGRPDYPVIDLTTDSLRTVLSASTAPGNPKRHLRVLVGLQNLTFETKAQLRSFLVYVHEWKDKHQTHYASAISDIRARRSSEATGCRPASDAPCTYDVTTDITLKQAQIKIRAAKSVWVIWQINKSYLCGAGTAQRYRLGVSLEPQEIRAVALDDITQSRHTFAVSPVSPDTHDARLRMPAIKVNSSVDMSEGRQSILANIEFGALTGKLKPVVLDRLLSLYQRLGADMRQIFEDYKEEASSMFATEPKAPVAAAQTPILFDIQVRVALVRIALQAEKVPAAVLFEALSLHGSASNRTAANQALQWHAKAQHLGLSLGALDSGPLSESIEPTGRYRSAYMQADVEVREIPGDIRSPSQLSVSLSKVHTVMQIAALSEISDLVSSWSSDLHTLKEKRAAEVAEVKARTSKILKRIEASERGIQTELSWFASRLLTIDITGFAVAVPLNRDMAIDLRPKNRSSVPAMLFSIRSINFQNRRNETARFRLQTMTLQFVHSFDQNVPTHFAGEYHQTDNLMSLPHIDAEAQMSSTADEWTLASHSCATDFKLTISPSIVDHVFQLIDMYRQGREHIAQLEKHYFAEHSSGPPSDAEIENSVKPTQRIVCRMSFEFQSGVVQLIHHGSGGQPGNRRPSAIKHDAIGLPKISLWLDYIGAHKDEDGAAIINMAIHGSQNELRPTILPFFVDLASRIERRAAQKHRNRTAAKKALPKEEGLVKPIAQFAKTASNIVRVSATLRIDQSKLRLFDPDSQAYVDLEWESGGFLAKTTIGAEENSTFAGTVSGVTTELSNTNEPENSCIRATARDMAVTVVYDPHWQEDHSGISIVFDTKVAAQFNLDKFSSWLTFVAVWVDNAPSLDTPIAAAITDTATAPLPRRLEKRKMGLAVLARFQEVDFDAKIDVTHAKLSIKPIVLQSTSDGHKTSVDLRIGVTEVTALGKVSGILRSDSLTFHTLRKSSRASEDTDPQLLSMSIKAGTLFGHLQLRDRSVAKFELLPTTVDLHDDWQNTSAPPNLTFAVDAGKFTGAVQMQTIAELLEKFYDVLDLVERQHFIANQRSEAFRNRTVQRNNEPSPIAVALMQSMQKVGKQMVDGQELDFAQVMHFQIAAINLGVFNNDDSQQVNELYRFTLGLSEVQLTSVPKRNNGISQQSRDLKVNTGVFFWDSQKDSTWLPEYNQTDITPHELLTRIMGRKTPEEVAMLPWLILRIPSTEDIDAGIFRYTRDMEWGPTKGDIKVYPQFYANIVASGTKLFEGIKHAEQRRWRHLRRIRPSDASLDEPIIHALSERRPNATDSTTRPRLSYIDLLPQKKMPVPNMAFFGQSTQDIFERFGAEPLKTAVEKLPQVSHRFITLTLEQGMELLLKLYARQLPDQPA